MVFADSDYFIGYLHARDFHHEKCLELSRVLDEEMITSWDVVDEVVTKLSYYVSKETALRFIKRVIEEKITVIFPSIRLLLLTREIFKSQRSGHISMTDCMNMAIAREKKIDTFLSFDRIYERNGFKLYGQ